MKSSRLMDRNYPIMNFLFVYVYDMILLEIHFLSRLNLIHVYP